MPTRNGGTPMPKKRPPPKEGEKVRRQYNCAFGVAVTKRIEETAATLGLDPVALLRMIVHAHLNEYERQARAIRAADSETD